MSIAARTWAKGQVCGAATLKAVLMSVADYADDNGVAWPSQSRIAADTELDRRTVRTALKTLADQGLLRREQFDREDGSRGADRLFLNMGAEGVTITAADHDNDGPGQSPGGGGESPGGGGEVSLPPRAIDPGGGGESPGLTTFEQTPEQSKEPSPSISAPDGAAGRKPRKPKPPIGADGFDEWWLVFPKKVGKDLARPAYQRIIREGRATPAELLAGAQRYAVERAGQEVRYTKHPAAWLNAGRWLDEPSGGKQAAPTSDAERSNGQRALVRRWKTSPTTWPRQLGPPPDEPGCCIPATILAEFSLGTSR